MLLEKGLFRTQEMLLQTSQRLFNATTVEVNVILQDSVLNRRGHRIQIDGIDAFDSDVDEAPKESVAFMTILSDYGLNVLSEIPNYNTYHDNTINVILYDQYLKESENEVVQSIVSHDQQNAMIMSIIEEMSS
ncbi:hypothetical protein Tco_1462343 [Tanacetum coccineum]